MTQIGYGPLERIDGPLPIPQVYGLLGAARAPAAGVRILVDTGTGPADLNDLSSTGESMDEAIARLRREGILPPSAGQERWLNGVEVFPYPTGPAELFDTCASDGSSGSKDFGDEDPARPQFGALTVYLAETCKSYRVWDQEAYKARASLALDAIESAAVARHLMTGEGLELNPHLADGQASILNSAAVTSMINGLALLENAIGETGKLGLIHLSPGAATALRERLAVDDRTGVIRTINGNVVIADAGYSAGSTPHGSAAPTGTQEWIYATGPLDVRRTEMFTMPEDVSQALDRGTDGSATSGRPNAITYRAERYYLIDWDTELQAAVLVDRCQTGCVAV